jgi:hypothetical protein
MVCAPLADRFMGAKHFTPQADAAVASLTALSSKVLP